MHGAKASIVFYKNVIAPYKGSLEEWFVNNKSLYIYFGDFCYYLGCTFPKTKLAWRVFKNLPLPPRELGVALNYIDT